MDLYVDGELFAKCTGEVEPKSVEGLHEAFMSGFVAATEDLDWEKIEGIECAMCGEKMKKNRKHMFICDECFDEISEVERRLGLRR